VEPRTSSSSPKKPRRTSAVTAAAASGSDCGRPKGTGRASLRSGRAQPQSAVTAPVPARRRTAEKKAAPSSTGNNARCAPQRLAGVTTGAKEGSAMKKVSSSDSQVKQQSRGPTGSEKHASKKRCNQKPAAPRKLGKTKLPATLSADRLPPIDVDDPSRVRSDAPIERYVGLDIGNSTEVCELKGGQVVLRTQVKDDDGLERLLGPETDRARVVLEAGRQSWYLYDLLSDWGHQVWVVDTTRVRQMGIGYHGRKNDRIDAEKLARAGQAGQVPKAWVLTHASQKLRHLMSLRRMLVGTRSQYVIAIRSTLRSLGYRVPTCATSAFARKLKEMQLPEEARALVRPLAELLDHLQPQIELVDTQVDEYCTPSPIIALLSSVPGVGRIVAAVYMSVIDQPLRFRNAHQVQSYLGLVPSEMTSGRRKMGSITKHGNSEARAMLVEAAWGVMHQRRSDPLKTWAMALARKKGTKVAAVALARRLAGILWAMWRDGTAYDPQCVGQPSARAKRKEAQQTEQTAAQIQASAAPAGGR